MVDLNVYASASLEKKHSRTIELIVLTNLHMHGAASQKGKPLEFRVPSLRGVMNYWWRAVQYNTFWKHMLRDSVAVFGGIAQGEKGEGRKSPVAIHYRPTKPHPLNAGSRIECRLMKTKHDSDLDRFHDILHLAVCLGGFGNRSRRGSGSLQFVQDQWATPEEYLETVEKLIRKLAPANSMTIMRANKGLLLRDSGRSKHPTIQSIWVSLNGYQDQSDAVDKITLASKRANPSNEQQYLGNISSNKMNEKRRVASPLHGSVCKINGLYHVVVTEVRPMDTYYEKKGYQEAKKRFLQIAVGGEAR